jgi:hypothetical protein
VDSFHGPVLDDLPRDVNWLLTLQCVLEAALAVGDVDVVETAARLLTPYEGRAVINAGAVMFHGTTDDTLARAAARLDDPATADRLRTRAIATYERLGAQWWRARLVAWSPAVGPDDDVRRPRQARLHPLADDLWLVGFDDDATPVRALRGFRYLRELLRRPGQPVSALDLVTAGTGAVLESGLGELLDKQALTAYRHRLRDIDHELAEADEWADVGRLDTLRAERGALLDEVGRATGLAGRTRTVGSSQERARIAARKAIAAAVDRIAGVNAPLARHLRTSVRTGLNCSYEPDPSAAVRWTLDQPS